MPAHHLLTVLLPLRPSHHCHSGRADNIRMVCCASLLYPHRQGSVEPYTLVDSPAAWHGRDYQDRFDEWALQFTPQHIAELDAAVAHVLANKTIVPEGNYLNLVS